jgi:hypothetical protein
MVITSAAGCAMNTSPSSEENKVAQSASSTCPTLSGTQSEERTAASVALQLMRLAAPQTSDFDQTAAWSILASQRYRVQSSGTGIEFDPSDNLYPAYVTSAMQAVLALPQEADPAFAKFLSDGLKAAYAHTNGLVYPALRSIAALDHYKGPGPVTVVVPDSTTNGYPNAHKVTLSTIAQPCGSQVFNFAETVVDSWQYAPLFADSIRDNWKTGPNPPQFTGTNNVPSTPFNGPSGNGYLVVSINGSPVNWSDPKSFAAVNCYNYPHSTCTGSIQLDPAPYSEPSDQFDVVGNIMGTQANPFSIDSNLLLADPSHATQWATRFVGGVQQWGTFSNPISRGGVTFYAFVRRY